MIVGFLEPGLSKFLFMPVRASPGCKGKSNRSCWEWDCYLRKGKECGRGCWMYNSVISLNGYHERDLVKENRRGLSFSTSKSPLWNDSETGPFVPPRFLENTPDCLR